MTGSLKLCVYQQSILKLVDIMLNTIGLNKGIFKAESFEFHTFSQVVVIIVILPLALQKNYQNLRYVAFFGFLCLIFCLLVIYPSLLISG